MFRWRRKHSPPPKNDRTKLRFECLEDRTVPSAEFIGSLTVPVTTATPAVADFTLEVGAQYRLVAHGTATVSTGSGLQSDAEYLLRANGPDNFGRSGSTTTDNGLRVNGVDGFTN